MSLKGSMGLSERPTKRFKGVEHDSAEGQLRLSQGSASQHRLPSWWETSVAAEANRQSQQSELGLKRTSSQTESLQTIVSLQTWAHAVQNSITLAERSDDADTEDTATSSCSSGNSQHGSLHVQSAADDADSLQVRFSFGVRPCLTPDLSTFEVIDQDVIDSLLSLAQC